MGLTQLSPLLLSLRVQAFLCRRVKMIFGPAQLGCL
ncbi:hypothetical protein XBLMG947_0976 [Xanthomonas bromi]|uniref:Uncharacterized protein n=1 Tax=Xanthomonas bromi TaxID=56449 RepID=A0A1C3NIG9_9XANT|nr:hypothetical protein XBLMG947_0976 [Xanthomonas bromi]